MTYQEEHMAQLERRAHLKEEIRWMNEFLEANLRIRRMALDKLTALQNELYEVRDQISESEQIKYGI